MIPQVQYRPEWSSRFEIAPILHQKSLISSFISQVIFSVTVLYHFTHPFLRCCCLTSPSRMTTKEKKVIIFNTKISLVTHDWAEINEEGNAFVSGEGGLRFKSRAGQIGHSVANGSPLLQRFFEWICVTRAQWRGDGPRKLVTRFGVLQRV